MFDSQLSVSQLMDITWARTMGTSTAGKTPGMWPDLLDIGKLWEGQDPSGWSYVLDMFGIFWPSLGGDSLKFGPET